MMGEPEFITILEGSIGLEFRFSPFAWSHSIYEGPTGMTVSQCQLRTATGEKILKRCTEAWQDRRPVMLEYKDEFLARQQIDVVAIRLSKVDEGELLTLWVQEPLDEEALAMMESGNAFGLFDEDDSEDDDSDDIVLF